MAATASLVKNCACANYSCYW